MATTSSNVTRAISQTAEYIQEKWNREILQPFDKALQAAPLVTDQSGLVSDGGDVLRNPFAGTINARAKAASTNITYDSPEGTAVSYNIDKHYYAGMLIEDIAKIQASYDLKGALMKRLSEALARQIDTDVLALYASAGTSVSAGAAVDDADIIAVVAAMDNANVPVDGNRHGVIGQYTKGDLLNVNKYVAYDQTGKTGKAVDGSSGLVGSLYGMDINMSQNVPVSTTGRNLFFHKDAIGLARQQQPKFEMEYSVDAIGWKIVCHTVYGVGALRTTAIVECTRTTAA